VGLLERRREGLDEGEKEAEEKVVEVCGFMIWLIGRGREVEDERLG
jgi:hypothetical protein